jgi:hypothetical protein
VSGGGADRRWMGDGRWIGGGAGLESGILLVNLSLHKMLQFGYEYVDV